MFSSLHLISCIVARPKGKSGLGGSEWCHLLMLAQCPFLSFSKWRFGFVTCQESLFVTVSNVAHLLAAVLIPTLWRYFSV